MESQNSFAESVEARNAMPQDAPETGRGLRPFAFYLTVILVFVADQVSKMWIQRTLPAWGGERRVIGDAFVLSLAYNHGGAWGMGQQKGPLFVAFASIAIIALLIAFHRMKRVELFVGAALALALGGALGNLLDRVRFGYVVDFFYVKIINFPIFNVADSAITIAICLLLLHFLRSARAESRAQALIADTPTSPTSLPE